MLRIIAGEMRSRRLKSPEGMDTRPTLDRVRESLFSILQNEVRGARVLDLYAGSGALALEALSRGAEKAVLVDCAPRACQAIRENIEALGCQDRATLLHMKDTAALDALARAGESFDLIFLDPPYRMDPAPICAALAEKGLLSRDGVIVTEHSRERTPDVPLPLALSDRRNYGIVGLSFYRWSGEEEAK
ncbi:MAG: 16S rRNA (guanine(966)-N(2))-methyltransferase RsmD [Clostridia bacterium]|nr:16S rRNA (guanine(966)-N(2))-methyltransferase RsmD [Clostridia bacterium]